MEAGRLEGRSPLAATGEHIKGSRQEREGQNLDINMKIWQRRAFYCRPSSGHSRGGDLQVQNRGGDR